MYQNCQNRRQRKIEESRKKIKFNRWKVGTVDSWRLKISNLNLVEVENQLCQIPFFTASRTKIKRGNRTLQDPKKLNIVEIGQIISQSRELISASSNGKQLQFSVSWKENQYRSRILITAAECRLRVQAETLRNKRRGVSFLEEHVRNY